MCKGVQIGIRKWMATGIVDDSDTEIDCRCSSSRPAIADLVRLFNPFLLFSVKKKFHKK
ncbi:unnamed protein product [Ceratitis capitata]|uniref:(Mediterranean fruit fly) hypothetical protein n=1 Tax=Ceratitis capitata TaxID=7213 RepID=A0A811U4L6_CERCA|nr:unnamed protein product [Ceratitis capitata]